jgi:hypothetical protein
MARELHIERSAERWQQLSDQRQRFGFTDDDVPILRMAFAANGASIGSYVVGASEQANLDALRHGIALGQQVFVCYGPAGSGKTTLIEQLAAERGAPFVLIAATAGSARVLRVGEQQLLAAISDQQLTLLSYCLAAPIGVVIVYGENAHLQQALGLSLASRQPLLIDDQPVMQLGANIIVFEVEKRADAVSESLTLSALEHTQIISDFPPPPAPLAQAQRLPTRLRLAAQARDREGLVELFTIRQRLGRFGECQRARTLSLLFERVSSLNSDFATPAGQRFLDRWLALVELQAFAGDQQATATMFPALAPLLPVEPADYDDAIDPDAALDTDERLINYAQLVWMAGRS